MKIVKIKAVKQFFILTFILSMPIYVLIGLTSMGVWLSPDVAFFFIPLATLLPAVSAIVLTKREGTWTDVKKLLLNCLSVKSIPKKVWLVPSILILPLLYFFVGKISAFTGMIPLDPMFPLVAIPFVFLIFFTTAFAEQIGWMGYAFEPMSSKIGERKASLVLGVIWALWHIPMWAFISKDFLLVSSLMLTTISLRILIVWFYSNTGKSILIAILLHAMYNVTIGAQSVHLPTASVILAIAALSVFPFLTRNRDIQLNTSS
jgi:membrane protease YdiL (CAAX protease family)